VPCAISIKERPESTQRVHITNIPKAMSDKNNQPSQPSTPSTQTKPVDPVPSKPTFPQNIDIRTGTQEPRKKV
ncbi:MAG: hypothetical protein JWL61_4186, partial [Gemmatimonadetes bacterium]|nr:hypothetical protein [Gemmatimonadota bacterium]